MARKQIILETPKTASVVRVLSISINPGLGLMGVVAMCDPDTGEFFFRRDVSAKHDALPAEVQAAIGVIEGHLLDACQKKGDVGAGAIGDVPVEVAEAEDAP